MKLLPCTFALLLALLVHSSSQGAELVLREYATQHGPIIRLGDIADIGASSPAELKILASTPLLPAPAPGTQQFLSAAQVRDLLTARGLQIERLTIQGAALVEIGSNTQPTKSEQEPQTPKLTHQAAELQVQQAIEGYLQSETSVGQWRVEVLLSERLVSQVAQLGVPVEARGQRKLRSGRQRFFLSSGEGEKELLVTATITQIQKVVVVRQRIQRDQLVRAVDVEILQREGHLPSGSLTDLEQVIGKVALRALRPDEILQKNHVRAAWQVRRGETVKVFVRTGGIVVRTRAVAKENGAMGDLIAVEMLEGKKRLTVSVSGPGEVAVYATGGRTTDYASLSRDGQLQELKLGRRRSPRVPPHTPRLAPTAHKESTTTNSNVR